MTYVMSWTDQYFVKIKEDINVISTFYNEQKKSKILVIKKSHTCYQDSNPKSKQKQKTMNQA
jgi:hypothetical protein